MKQEPLDDNQKRLKREIDAIKSRLWFKDGDSLDEVVQKRLGAGNYVEELGIVHKAQEDLERLSNALLSKKGQKQLPRGDPRIVLFIDDLDRCPPEKVVEMLEALQLHVKTKLFVVVADLRFVILALEKKYEGILNAKSHPSGLDFLEKIIQLPYRVPPIEKDKAMVRNIEAQLDTINEDDPSAAQDEKKKQDQNPDDKKPEDEKPEDTKPEDKKPEDEKPEDKKPEDEKSEDEKPEDTKPVEDESDTPVSTNNMVTTPVYRYKIHMLAIACSAASVNPRSVRRLTNVVKIMKIIWHYEGEPEEALKRACVFFLAMCASKSLTLLRGMGAIFTRLRTLWKRHRRS